MGDHAGQGASLDIMDPKSMTGLSLVGLLTTLAVLALLLGLGLPSWQGLLERQRLRALQDGVAARLHEAKGQARRLGHDVSLIALAGADGRAWRLALDGRGDCDCRLTACRLAGRAYRPLTDRDFPGIRLSVLPRHGRITFHAERGTASAGSVRLIGRAAEGRLVVASSGRIRRCALGLPGQAACAP